MYRKKEYTLGGDKVVLVPYCPEHVPKYHSWMQSEELREQTASERLTLQEEYEMQQKWISDDDKSTFIVLSKQLYEDVSTSEIDSMVGDVNLFFNDSSDVTLAEVEVMVAEPSVRRQGLASEAVLLMMLYATEELNINKFRVKILENNTASLHLFQTKLNFTEVGRNAVFHEVVLELCAVTAASIKDKMTAVGLKNNQLNWKLYSPKPSHCDNI
ncbi:N-acetyltransferase 9-like protein [Dysidea avara]|uniref:N-acetyltransferase 9-like protein n=1 Tax=Dysidea avara TaxID=196820 RepID=UPI00332E8689